MSPILAAQSRLGTNRVCRTGDRKADMLAAGADPLAQWVNAERLQFGTSGSVPSHGDRFVHDVAAQITQPAVLPANDQRADIREPDVPLPQHGRKRMSPKRCCAFVLNISLECALAFEVVPRLIGRDGVNMKQIAKACQGKVRIRGRGSRFREKSIGGREANLPLQVALSCLNDKDFEKGRELLTDLLNRTEVAYKQFCGWRGIEPPLEFYTIVDYTGKDLLCEGESSQCW
eukprot:gnl/TRDRNA2_/TRDRNA2_139831_c1_seq1.p1 gnl/TRDRNA2_/TRDRNA2_139831_c1~~gnl/TRDRNA2_/TRDRNA2_139831_c1_seq1.p1  ORF type:complete len:253 (+),score=29.27 gnl/TRDRNA2_/TRDRNA2_139831_c1_seq1:67-759(+)